MRRIAIVGSGISGLAAAHGLLQAGYSVDLYSDRTAQQWLNESRPTGTAARFAIALSYERELGLNFWDDAAPKGEGVFLTFCPTLHNPLVRLLGRFREPFQAVDLRLQSHRWMNELERRGGQLQIEQVTVDRLDEIAADHDLTIVATGRADLCRIFERDERRSVYGGPQRNLAMVIVTGMPERIEGLPLLPVKFDFLGTDGEIFFIPYLHKDAGPCWNILVEAKAGSRMDRFADVHTGVEAVARVKQVISELFPWDEPFVRHMDIIARGDGPFDDEWITATFEDFYDEHARHAWQFSNLLLEPITAPAKELLIAQYGSDGRAENHTGPQRIANAFVENFNDPRLLTPAFTEMSAARRAIAAHTEGRWLWNGVRGRASIARDQVKGKLGIATS